LKNWLAAHGDELPGAPHGEKGKLRRGLSFFTDANQEDKEGNHACEKERGAKENVRVGFNGIA